MFYSTTQSYEITNLQIRGEQQTRKHCPCSLWQRRCRSPSNMCRLGLTWFGECLLPWALPRLWTISRLAVGLRSPWNTLLEYQSPVTCMLVGWISWGCLKKKKGWFVNKPCIPNWQCPLQRARPSEARGNAVFCSVLEQPKSLGNSTSGRPLHWTLHISIHPEMSNNIMYK